MTWNGDLSHINREAEQERKEALKRSHEYDDEQDRGKVSRSCECYPIWDDHSWNAEKKQKKKTKNSFTKMKNWKIFFTLGKFFNQSTSDFLSLY